MMIAGWIARIALKTGAPQWLVKALAIVIVVALAVLAWNLWLDGHDDEVIEDHEAEVQLEVERGGRAADRNQIDRAARDAAEISRAREEFDNATKHIPNSEGLTRRQRVDACAELRAQRIDTSVITQCQGL